ncbi:MAG: hypothetical protein IM606_14030 [Cytophagales bacterium]|nr:hypothetical protein [Cytophagales bacterium]MCA6389174.1 hypothetical protein [Cytophagales bacterium]MCA6390323.1 hypothetical protein [Cytophagales bacterium]MCA6396298.1 hypothetical protein [Cytophagales bacterium]MCA6402228.1 hypothetical protein [Cytophagales bacterium]
MNKVRDVLVNDSRFKLHNSFGNFRGYSKNVTAVFNEYKVMNSVGKAFGKSMFGVGLALTPPLLVLRVSNGAGLTNKRDKLG